MRALIGAISAGILLIGLSGCGSERQSVPLKESGYDFPLDAFYPLKDQELVMQRAQGALTARCMLRFGYRYQPPEPVAGDIRATRERTFGLVDEAEAARDGYTGPVIPAGSEKPEPKLPEAEYTTLTGIDFSSGEPRPAKGRVPKDGCAGEAGRQLAAGADGLGPDALDELTMHTYHQAEADQRVKAKFGEWSVCMKAKGFAYANPWEPNDSPKWVPGKPTTLEKKTAVADVRCKHSTGLVDTWHAVMVEYQRKAIEQNAVQLDRLTKSTATKVANAKRVLAG
ncbi:hypothetical protein [Tenggerimyces flavus]|uniref:Lipoprotein n=1 Tax=Tenggerimyces flavus TaxID=1708749 RepID=A0ABV7Y6K1_9ACTN|nr:hypothetical protein [Tenggerimyces flavus]MBM7791074.1 hypothetical protein [Tenggerimyces flavus]